MSQKSDNKKKQYKKPSLKKIELAPNEAILAGCKNNLGPNATTCTPFRDCGSAFGT
jgi:hypothetical protein